MRESHSDEAEAALRCAMRMHMHGRGRITQSITANTKHSLHIHFCCYVDYAARDKLRASRGTDNIGQ